MKRRTFLGLLVAGGSAIFAGIIGVPTLLLGLSPVLQRRVRERWRPVGRLEAFPVGRTELAHLPVDRTAWPKPLPTQSVFVWRQADASVVVFSRSCTDLGCPLNYERGSGCFLCPCHGGIFSQDGQRLAGPPDRPMDRFAHRIRDGVLEIDVESLPPGV
jgi:menaquinol-cytochrome c reductase iron-sulfur subunit